VFFKNYYAVCCGNLFVLWSETDGNGSDFTILCLIVVFYSTVIVRISCVDFYDNFVVNLHIPFVHDVL